MSAQAVGTAFDVVTMGRIGVDIYPQQVGVSLREVDTFGKYLGGSATNVAVAAARYGRRSAVITRAATMAALKARDGTEGVTILDLDYRPMFWSSREDARAHFQLALQHVTVAVGNKDERETAVDRTEPQAAAEALLAYGLDLAVVKQGPKGVIASDGKTRVEVPPVPVEVVNGLGAGDAFGGALCHGLLSGWDLERMMRFCNAAGAIVASRLACSDAMPDAAEVEAKLKEAVHA
jgi:5-dehydro-2-deoxygluconokinase